ncbi:MAG: carboxylesterase [Betaproteobacteria bacterium HGW-Betaproteobacteria-8]|nr:MAG: carboxylesterase [Betaproteobacteria bacterium HGW-Betaproteobacteria-8]
MLETLELNNSENTNASIIWLHGLGADGHDFEPIVAELDLPAVRFILPHAPYRAVTLNNGYEMRAWYDIYGLSPDSPQDESGIRQSQVEIETLISAEKARGIPASRIVLAGFSQGGAIALHTALRHEETLAGVLALSSYLPLKTRLKDEVHVANRELPIFMAHGSFDNIISMETAQISAQLLLSQNYRLAWHEYAMAHSVCNEEIADIRKFLCSILGI